MGIALLVAPAAQAVAPTPLVGSLHEHSGYSDGWPGSRPGDLLRRRASAFGLDFMGGSEHSDNADLPIVASDYCLDPLVAPQCALADPVNPLDSFRKWDATARAGARGHRLRASPPSAASSGRSDRFGHINVYFSRNDTNAKGDGGYATMDAFYSWFTRAPRARRRRGRPRDVQPPRREVARATPTPASTGTTSPTCRPPTTRMVGIEVFNDTQRLRRPWYSRTRSTRAGTWARSAPRTSATGAPTTGAGRAGRRP